MTATIKAEQLTPSKWRVLAIPFGGPFAGGKDLDGEYFSARTDIKPDWFDRRPILWHHAKDETIGDASLGVEDDLERKRDGWWATAWLDRSSEYWAMVDALLRAGKVYGSSGSIGHGVRIDRETGEILVWPHVEQTLTPTPANPYARVVPSKALDHYTTAGIAVPDAIRALLTDPAPADLRDDLPTGGGSAAMARLAGALDSLDEVIRLIR